MDWINELLWKETVAHTILLYSIVIASGVILGKIKIFGISLGITFVLFAGIAVGHFGFSVNHQVIDFIKDFGLILFVFSIGLQVGPGFFSSFRKGGISLNIMALSIIFLGALTTLIIHFITGTSMPMLVGIMSGAVTNTPGLGAAQQALKQVSSGLPDSSIPEIGLGYAVAYPFGVIGIILTMLLMRKAGSVSLKKELELYNLSQHPAESTPKRICVKVTNPKIFNNTISELSKQLHSGIVISRILHDGEIMPAKSETVISENDVLLIVAQKGLLNEIIAHVGVLSELDLSAASGRLISRQILVTNKRVFGKNLSDFRLRSNYNVNVTRGLRAGFEFVASPHLKLQMGDKLTVVGDEASVEKVAMFFGDSIKLLNEPNLVPIFIGILLGVILGSIPIMVHGIPNPIKLGIAGGPLIVAILLSKFGHRIKLTSYTTPSANLMLREVGIVLFLASIGIAAGEKFIPTLISGDGFVWMGYGAMITLIPILLTAIFSRFILKRNYFEICGLLSGSMTDPPALAYANSIAQSEAPAIAYVTVYPLAMFMRILIAQFLILLFA